MGVWDGGSALVFFAVFVMAGFLSPLNQTIDIAPGGFAGAMSGAKPTFYAGDNIIDYLAVHEQRELS